MKKELLTMITNVDELTIVEFVIGTKKEGKLPIGFWYELLESTDFESFFVCVYRMILKANIHQLRTLRKAMDLFIGEFSCSSIVYLLDIIDTESFRKEEIKSRERERNEYYYQNKIVEKFEQLFPEYCYVGKEVKVDKIGRIDILAKDTRGKRDVIIECKMACVSPNKQLIAYSKKYKNPILVAITEKSINEKRRLPQIKYYTYSELGID